VFSLANTILWQVRAEDLYFGISLASGRALSFPPNLATIMNRYFHSLLAMYFLHHAGLWCVKFSLLFFFRGLGRNIRRQMVLWWCACAFIVASLVVCIGILQYECLTTPFPRSVGKYPIYLSSLVRTMLISSSDMY
jgi:hypothetical protein